MELVDITLKAAKKALKKNESMKLKDLTQVVVSKVKRDDLSAKDVQAFLEKSKKFQIDGKVVTLKRKRAKSPKDPQEELTKTSKKSKKNPSSDSAVADLKDDSAVEAWRKENKIVVMHSSDDQEKTKEIAECKEYFPFNSFDTPACKEAISAALINQCTEVNGFSKPSPIQAQSWPIMTQVLNGKKRDVVGIAETGKTVDVH